MTGVELLTVALTVGIPAFGGAFGVYSKLNERFEHMERRMDSIELALVQLKSREELIDNKISNLQESSVQRFERNREALQELKDCLNGIEACYYKKDM